MHKWFFVGMIFNFLLYSVSFLLLFFFLQLKMVVIVNTFDSNRQSAVSKTQKPVPAFVQLTVVFYCKIPRMYNSNFRCTKLPHCFLRYCGDTGAVSFFSFGHFSFFGHYGDTWSDVDGRDLMYLYYVHEIQKMGTL